MFSVNWGSSIEHRAQTVKPVFGQIRVMERGEKKERAQHIPLNKQIDEENNKHFDFQGWPSFILFQRVRLTQSNNKNNKNLKEISIAQHAQS